MVKVFFKFVITRGVIIQNLLHHNTGFYIANTTIYSAKLIKSNELCLKILKSQN